MNMKRLKIIINILGIIGLFIALSGFLLEYLDDYPIIKKFISKDYYFIEKEYKKCLDNKNYFLAGKKANRFLLIIKPLEKKYNRRIPINKVWELRVEPHIGTMIMDITSGKGLHQTKYRLKMILFNNQMYEIRMDDFMKDIREMLNYEKMIKSKKKQLYFIGFILSLLVYIFNIFIDIKSKNQKLKKSSKKQQE